MHDIFWLAVFLMVFFAVMFFAPEVGGYFLEYNNFIPADPLKTPAHIAPVWYFTPFYSMLRATTDQLVYVLALGTIGMAALLVLTVAQSDRARLRWPSARWSCLLGYFTLDAKFWGVVVMGGAVLIFLPALARPVAGEVDPLPPGWHFWLLIVWVVAFLVLGYLGTQPPSPAGQYSSKLGTLIYFGFFLLMPWWSRMGTFKPVPERVTFRPH